MLSFSAALLERARQRAAPEPGAAAFGAEQRHLGKGYAAGRDGGRRICGPMGQARDKNASRSPRSMMPVSSAKPAQARSASPGKISPLRCA